MPTSTESGTQLTQRCSGPVLWDVVDKDGVIHASFSDKNRAGRWAEQNLGAGDTGEDAEPNGWYLQALQPLQR